MSQQARIGAVGECQVLLSFAGIDRLVLPPYFPALARHCRWFVFIGCAINEDRDHESQKFT